jgi:2-amino-4-hydroxy-6-hydroxymethyldihydropteridine diphosphokinase
MQERLLILALGSNLPSRMGDRLDNIDHAITRIGEFVKNIRLSNIYESAALVLPNSPEDWQQPFLNMVIAGNCNLGAEDILNRVKAIERDIGRKPSPKWSPREIDIDIIGYGDLQITSEHLSIPHPLFKERDFVTIPLLEVAEEWANNNGISHNIPHNMKLFLRKEENPIKLMQ